MTFAAAVLLFLFSIVLLLLHKPRFHFLLHVILITGMAFLVLIFLISVTAINADTGSSILSTTIFQSRFIFLALYCAAFFSYPLRHLKFSFQKQIAGYFVMISLILAIVFLAFNRSNKQSVKTAKLVDHSHEVIRQAEQIRTEVAEMQNAVRGFLITGDETYLPPFTFAITVVDDHMARLKKLTIGNALQLARIDTLRNLMTAFAKSRTEQIRVRRASKFDEERIKQTLREGKEIIDPLRASIITIQQEELKLLVTRKASNEKTIQSSSRVITLFQFISVLLLVSAFIIIYNNIRRRNKLEKEIKQNNIFLETILENIPSMIFVKEPGAHRFIQVNQEAEKTFGLSREEILGKCDYDLFPKEEAEAYFNAEKEVFASGKPLEIPAQLIHTANGDRWLRRNKIPVYNSNNDPLYLIGISEDITEKKIAEEQLKEYKYFFDNSNDLCLIANEQGYFETITPKVEEALGYSYQEITETPFIQLVHPDDIAVTLLIYDELKSGATVINFVNRYRKKDGSYLWFDWNASPNPVTHKLYCIARDITERKMLEDKLNQFNRELEQKVKDRTRDLSNSEQRFRALIENSSDAISLVDAAAKLIYQSPAAQDITGVSTKDRNSGSAFLNIHPDDLEQSKKLYTALLEQPGIAMPLLFRAIHQRGHCIWVEGTATNLLHDEAVKAIVINFRDVTHRVEAEENIKNSEEKRRLIMSAAIDAIICMDTKGVVTFWNPQAEKTFGWKEEEVKGGLLAEFIIPPAFREMHTKGLQNYLNTGDGPVLNKLLELSAINKEGKEFPIELTILPIKQGGEEFFCAFIRDISQRKHSELLLKQLNESLERRAAELFASNTELERFAYIASHDLQEPLRMVSSFMGLLEEGLDGQLDAANKQYLHFAVDGAERMKKLIQDLLLYSRVGANKEEFVPTDLNEVMAYTTRVLEEDITKNGAILTVNPMPVIKANKSLITQLFVNLVNNALKYHAGKKPEIKVGYTEEQGNYIFYVKDNGIGIDPKFFDKIFIIFQRLHSKTEYSGTGIGLAICKKIVDTHKGKIWVASEKGKGSTFYFSIPKHII